MYKNAKIRIYPTGINLLKVNHENSRTQGVQSKKDTGTTPLILGY